MSESSCTFGKRYELSDTFEEIQNETFAVSYEAGQASGLLGYESVTLSGINIPRQKLGIATRATIVGDGISPGFIGFGPDYLTSIHPADYNVSNFNQSFEENRTTYEGVFTSMWKPGKVDPYFSLAIDRTPVNISVDTHGGYLALGTLPPVQQTNRFATTPVEALISFPTTHYNAGWTLSVQEVTYWHETNSTSFQATVDSGNKFNLYPPETAAEVNAAFDPPAVLLPNDEMGPGVYAVSCTAKPPGHGLKIGNQTFYHDPRDFIIHMGDSCVSGIAAAYPVEGIGLFYLGSHS